MRFYVKIGSIKHKGWGEYFAYTKAEVVTQVKKQIENLSPLNMGEASLEEYRNRYRGLPILVRQQGEDDYTEFND